MSIAEEVVELWYESPLRSSKVEPTGRWKVTKFCNHSLLHLEVTTETGDVAWVRSSNLEIEIKEVPVIYINDCKER